MPNQRRVYMVAEKIRDLVAMQLNSVADPRFSLVTVTSAVVSPDLRQAKIYWTTSGDKERIAEVQEAFENAQGLFKRALSKSLGIRFVPNLRFYYDDTLDTMEEVEDLFNRVRDQEGRVDVAGPDSEDEEK